MIIIVGLLAFILKDFLKDKIKIFLKKLNDIRKERIRNGELEGYWEEEVIRYEEKIKNYLKDSSENGFNKMVDDYQSKYDWNYGRDDIIIDEKHGYRKKFQNIPDFEQYSYKNIDINKNKDLINNKTVFNSDDHLKDSLTKEEKNDFEWKFKIYRAVKRKGEFKNQSSIYNLANKINAKRLLDIMRECTFHSSCALKETIELQEILIRIRNYVDVSRTRIAENFFARCFDVQYSNVSNERRELFEEAFDLYQKLTNTGIANRDNYLKYEFRKQYHASHKDSKDYQELSCKEDYDILSKITGWSTDKIKKEVDERSNDHWSRDFSNIQRIFFDSITKAKGKAKEKINNNLDDIEVQNNQKKKSVGLSESVLEL